MGLTSLVEYRESQVYYPNKCCGQLVTISIVQWKAKIKEDSIARLS